MKISNNYTTQNCPFCGSGKVSRVGEIGYSDPTLFSTVIIELENVAYLTRCECCDSAFTQNSIVDSDLIKLYSDANSGDRWSRAVFQENKPAEIVKTLSSLIFQDAVVVDVGCNTGEFLDFAKSYGARTIGVELSKSSREVITHKGHEGLENIEQIENQTVDVITAFDLIEHLHNPNEFITLCVNKLKKDGKLVLLTGNINSISARLSGSAWWYCSYPEHISFISKKYLSNIRDLTLDVALPTYASRAYKRSFLRIIFGFLLRFPLGRYVGLPSIGADHFLYILRKS